jgi:hypothetical protein
LASVLGGLSSRWTGPPTKAVCWTTWEPSIELVTAGFRLPPTGRTTAMLRSSIAAITATPSAGAPLASANQNGGRSRTAGPSHAAPRPTGAWTAAWARTSTSRKLPKLATPRLTPMCAWMKSPIGPNAVKAAPSPAPKATSSVRYGTKSLRRTAWTTIRAAPTISTGSTRL